MKVNSLKKISSIVLNNFTNDSRVLKENISLHNAGYDVTVVALYESSLQEYDEVNGVNIHRVKLRSRKWSKNKFVQLFKYIEFVYKVVEKYKNSDIIHCNDLDTLPIGIIIKNFYNKNIKIVYDAHEYETETNALHGTQKKFAKWLEKYLIQYVDAVITVSDSIANEYVKLYCIKKPALVLNAPLYVEIEKKDIFRETFSIDKEQTIFLYQGGLGSERGIEILLETFKYIADNKFVIVFMGYGSFEDLIQNIAKKYENIYFHPAVSPDVLLDYTCSADIGIHMAQDNCLSYRYALPNKILEYTMAELPILVTNLPEMSAVVNKYNIGKIIKGNTSNDLKEAIKDILNENLVKLKENTKRAKKIYNWENQEKILLKIYKEIIDVK